MLNPAERILLRYNTIFKKKHRVVWGVNFSPKSILLKFAIKSESELLKKKK